MLLQIAVAAHFHVHDDISYSDQLDCPVCAVAGVVAGLAVPNPVVPQHPSVRFLYSLLLFNVCCIYFCSRKTNEVRAPPLAQVYSF